mgnify:CR=1 FL=1
MAQCVNWIFGRGVSLACNLRWTVPLQYSICNREEKIQRIKSALRTEMESPLVDSSTIETFFDNLKSRTATDWRHRLITTNWDTLLEKEISALGLEVLPHWLADSYVYHLNGTIEDHADTKHLSPFLLEEDDYTQRTPTTEANQAFNYLIWGNVFFVVGMSFECETDRGLLSNLRKIQDEVPIGQSTWIVLNPDFEALQASSTRIASALPRARVYTKQINFHDWMNDGMRPLKELNVFSF